MASLAEGGEKPQKGYVHEVSSAISLEPESFQAEREQQQAPGGGFGNDRHRKIINGQVEPQIVAVEPLQSELSETS